MQKPLNAKHDQPRWPVIFVLCAYTLAIRLTPFVLSRFGFSLNTDVSIYPWNFSPMLAVCLFGGAFYQSKSLALWLPIALMFVGDVGILAITGRADLVSIPISLSVYACVLVSSLLGFGLREQRHIGRTASASLLGCLIFFLVTNAVVWLSYPTYPRTPAGLLECYYYGLPYLRNTLISAGVFTTLLFSPIGVRSRALPSTQLETATA